MYTQVLIYIHETQPRKSIPCYTALRRSGDDARAVFIWRSFRSYYLRSGLMVLAITPGVRCDRKPLKI